MSAEHPDGARAEARNHFAAKPAGSPHHDDIAVRFTWHPPKEGQPERYQLLRAQARELAYSVDANVPDSREKSLALTKLEECVMWANAAIARRE